MEYFTLQFKQTAPDVWIQISHVTVNNAKKEAFHCRGIYHRGQSMQDTITKFMHENFTTDLREGPASGEALCGEGHSGRSHEGLHTPAQQAGVAGLRAHSDRNHTSLPAHPKVAGLTAGQDVWGAVDGNESRQTSSSRSAVLQ